MPEWIAEVDRIDKYLHSIGMPDNLRLRAVADIADVLAQADKRRRDMEAYAAECRRAYRLLPHGVNEAARELGVHRVTVYRRAKVARSL